jgi:hypothetical protein
MGPDGVLAHVAWFLCDVSVSWSRNAIGRSLEWEGGREGTNCGWVRVPSHIVRATPHGLLLLLLLRLARARQLCFLPRQRVVVGIR